MEKDNLQPRHQRLSRAQGKWVRASANLVLDASKKKLFPPLPPTLPSEVIEAPNINNDSDPTSSNDPSDSQSMATEPLPKLSYYNVELLCHRPRVHRRVGSDSTLGCFHYRRPSSDTWDLTPTQEFIDLTRKQINTLKKHSASLISPETIMPKQPQHKFNVQYANRH